ncbi:hypothetical protein LP419_11860 [Massilia sp. H-1]|nr:hypothetical protein LP419_11860 [Massilia sp. H-1]
MFVLTNEELYQVSGAGPITIADLACQAVPLAASIGAAACSSAAIEAAGGIGAMGALGATTGGIMWAGLVSSFIAGYGIGSLLGNNDQFKDGLSDVFLEVFGSD